MLSKTPPFSTKHTVNATCIYTEQHTTACDGRLATYGHSIGYNSTQHSTQLTNCLTLSQKGSACYLYGWRSCKQKLILLSSCRSSSCVASAAALPHRRLLYASRGTGGLGVRGPAVLLLLLLVFLLFWLLCPTTTTAERQQLLHILASQWHC